MRFIFVLSMTADAAGESPAIQSLSAGAAEETSANQNARVLLRYIACQGDGLWPRVVAPMQADTFQLI